MDALSSKWEQQKKKKEEEEEEEEVYSSVFKMVFYNWF
jgi:hypothetical protein